MNTEPLSSEVSETIKGSCELLRKIARTVYRKELSYDETAIQWLSWFIGFLRDRPNEDAKKKLLYLIGSFLGEALIARYGGEWVFVQGRVLAVRLPSGTVGFPFQKVFKQYQHGENDSIWGLYTSGDVVEGILQRRGPPKTGGVEAAG